MPANQQSETFGFRQAGNIPSAQKVQEAPHQRCDHTILHEMEIRAVRYTMRAIAKAICTLTMDDGLACHSWFVEYNTFRSHGTMPFDFTSPKQ